MGAEQGMCEIVLIALSGFCELFSGAQGFWEVLGGFDGSRSDLQHSSLACGFRWLGVGLLVSEEILLRVDVSTCDVVDIRFRVYKGLGES